MSSFGVLVEDIGTQSFRKRVASELSNTPGGPEAVNVWLRAGWTLGSVQGRCIFAGSDGDQFVGRGAAGHNVNDVEFSCLPPHFKDVGLSKEQWEAAQPTFYPSSFRQITPFLVASLSHHYIWLQHNLGKHHPLFLAPIWTDQLRASTDSSYTTTDLESFRDSVLSEIRYFIGASKCPDPQPVSTAS
ncbi:hypothetical protein H257_14552 [Aphanomyces astaci]|uniref:Uncharacterized protein n=1 Tax=Aphanomyces astaci TaxID=112090 RepID=W4FS87_APHAT|nr:hypothetical protein H257_14552 [Aphanomyces astaci]ETV69689.1 hypothetical protein H257_14552 [Aphanomyces astaci]|eukprot:XP_009840703.1 hypothetical protein H257_14552 [Aphanomyces astaci]